MASRHIRIIVVASSLLLLSACGSGFQPPAAVVNGDRIPQATLQLRLDDLLKEPQFASQVTGPGGAEQKKDLTRRLLAFLIQEQMVEAYARHHGLTVTGAEVQRTLSGVVAQQGGMAKFDQLLRQRHLSLAHVRENIRVQILQQKVQGALATARFGPQATPQQASQAFQDWLRRALRTADIEVNPLYGRFDPAQARICPIQSTAATPACPTA